MIEYIKIFGERNSGTNYLEQLLLHNTQDINMCENGYNKETGWKHGFPQTKKLSSLDIDKTLFIFIIRDLNPWLASMFKNPYHYIPGKNIDDFLNKRMNTYDCRHDHDVNIFANEKKNIFSLRYSKIRSYLSLFENVNNAIFVNLENLQKNPRNLFDFIKKVYCITVRDEFINITNHVKSKVPGLVNRKWDVKIPGEIIKTKRIEGVEDFIRGLKGEYYYKSGFLQYDEAIDEDADEAIDEDADEDVGKDVDEDADEDVGKDVGKDADEDVDEDADEDVGKDVDEAMDEDADEDADEDTDKKIVQDYVI